ncbi:hypothetical protein ACI77O_13490 [Pseudomonas tritici]|uniref:hypothetical protein n=1 Tax=Pseudomonas tritici TaxID=2745518 RepID=UPI00387AC94A
MERTLLTPDDKLWLGELAEMNRMGFDFILYNLTKKDNESDQGYAGAVPVWYEGSFVPAIDALRSIEEKVTHSQIFEQWESSFYQDVVRVCEALSAFDSQVLMMASGFHLRNWSDIYRAEGEAVQEAYEALYGTWEDHNDDVEYD